ncbi:DUF7289 family protein [Salinibaculum rarum]|uniref:DUF7289 family protein n=1 Tax=Salinibaculum rarum TaxID=3058903 RepID=UPI00265DA724|nr:hypothetical protein [Salinibaculum sp. KK48]
MGVNVLGSVSDNSAVSAAESNMGELRNEFTDIASEGAPYREVEMQAVDNTIRFESYTQNQTLDDTVINITASGGNVDLTGSDAVVVTARPIVYDLPKEDTKFVYTAGLIAQQYSDPSSESRLRKTPHMTVSPSRTAITLPATERADASPPSVGMSGTGKLYVTGSRSRKSTETVYRTASGSPDATTTVNITVSSIPPERVQVWAEFFRESGFTNVQVRDGSDSDNVPETVDATVETETVYIQYTEISVELSKDS